MAHDVFISYSAEDRLLAFGVCAALEAARVRCWLFSRDNNPGRDYADVIVQAIENSRVFVLIYSESSNVSPSVRKEVTLAADAHLHIVNFRVVDTPLSRALRFHLGNIHWLDALTPPMEANYARLVQAVQDLLAIEKPTASSGDPEADPVPKPSPQVVSLSAAADRPAVETAASTGTPPASLSPSKQAQPPDVELLPQEQKSFEGTSQTVGLIQPTAPTTRIRRLMEFLRSNILFLSLLIAAVFSGACWWALSHTPKPAIISAPSPGPSLVIQQPRVSPPPATPAPPTLPTPVSVVAPASTPTAIPLSKPAVPQTREVPSEHYKTIQSAIDASEVGDTVYVRSGSYTEAINFKAGINLVGDGLDGEKATVVRSPAAKGNILTAINCDSGWISDLAFEQLDRDGMKDPSFGIALSNSGVDFRRCRLSHVKNSGIVCFGNDRSRVQDCDVSDCGNSGIFVYNEGTITMLLNNKVHDNAGAGIAFDYKAKGRAEFNVCTKNAGSGISIVGAGTLPILRNNKSTGNTDYGLFVGKDVVKLDMLDSDADLLSDNAKGSIQYEPRTLEVPSDLYKTVQSAIEASRAGDTVHIKGGHYTEVLNFKSGIQLVGDGTEGEQATVVSCPIVQDHVLSVANCASGMISYIVFQNDSRDEHKESLHAILLSNSSVEMRHCRAYAVQNSGIVCYNKDKSSVQDCVATGCGENGILVTDVGTAPVLTGNDLEGNRYNGIGFQQGATGRAEANTCKGNHQDGIEAVGKETAPIVQGNRCEDNDRYGMFVAVGGKLDVSDVDLKLMVGNKAGALFREPRKLEVPSDQFRTVQAAIDAAYTGDTVHVKGGEYVEALTLTKVGINLTGDGIEGNT